ncbi:uncharacterized protein JCM10292_000095 [Rhodotorula paludigena]|uniref:uncharacterized protein n=1 Tax=Rhodotorula paludigena TaxID=86838 RepID=UPI00318028F5
MASFSTQPSTPAVLLIPPTPPTSATPCSPPSPAQRRIPRVPPPPLVLLDSSCSSSLPEADARPRSSALGAAHVLEWYLSPRPRGPQSPLAAPASRRSLPFSGLVVVTAEGATAGSSTHAPAVGLSTAAGAATKQKLKLKPKRPRLRRSKSTPAARSPPMQPPSVGDMPVSPVQRDTRNLEREAGKEAEYRHVDAKLKFAMESLGF